MASTIDKIKNDIIEAMNASQKRTSAYDTEAEIVRVDGDTAWVHIAGGVSETPVALTINAKKGDKVQVRVTNGGAWIMGNATAPPTDDAKANEADKKAAEAKYLAVDAADAAIKADIAAQDAVGSAETARTAAETAKTIAEGVEDIAKDAQEDAMSAHNSASQAIGQLGIVEDIVGVLTLVQQNGVYVRTTDQTAQEGKWYFIRTGSGTSADPYVYQVQNNPTFEYVITEDTSVLQDKPYYTRSGTGTEADPYVYTEVENPTGNPQSQGYYENTNWGYFELDGIDSTIQNYVSSHLVLAGNSLFLQTDEGDGSTRLELNTQNGMTLYDQTGNQVAQYGANTIIGNTNTFGIKIGESPDYILTNDTAIIPSKKYYERSGSGTTADPYVYTLVDNPVVADIGTYYENVLELGFYQEGERVAYINNNSLYITQTVVLQEMHLGERVENGGLGQWSWCVHPIGGQNNLYLKWLG